MAPIVVAAILIAGALIYEKEKRPVRRLVQGKSGSTWYTAPHPKASYPTQAEIDVFNSASGNDLVLTYLQTTTATASSKVGDRFVVYAAPTSLAAIAANDFGPFINQGKSS
jgi:hypothetical protein